MDRESFICEKCGIVTPQEYESFYKHNVCRFCDKEHYGHTPTELFKREVKMEATEIRDKILSFRAKYELTQHQLSAMSGLSHTTINKLENCKPVTQFTIAKINLFIDNYAEE